MTAATLPLVARGVRAEWIRAGGRGRLWTVLVPAAILVPVAISFGIAVVAESFARIPGQLTVLAVSTANAGYWVITISVVLGAVAGADGQAAESRYHAGEHVRVAIPRVWPVLAGRWLFYGGASAGAALAALAAVLVGLPVVSPLVYGAVSLTDPVGLRLLWTVPLLAFFAAGAGVGVGALAKSPLVAAAVIVVWTYIAEPAVGYLPSGIGLQRFMPVLNTVYATGQDAVLGPPWGRNGALLYVCALCAAVLLVATIGKVNRK
ncbi:ABC transporter permease [Mycolicibacterium palauense]|uniref:ABC transporter permease n=1 Tax=Mycolicibacterium palauense TaxID=2034511 RepID=UPI001FE602E0|nr:ABC transporter permease [Mycolicibacterium palauense]